jgi:5-formyltetrahydrofolate cyclo-ligase
VLVLGVAFDGRCRRLGRGKGFYDRLLADEKCRAFRCRLTFDLQVVAEMSTGPGDIPLDAVVCETGVYACQTGPLP